jgi:hypothetical protein
VVAPASHEVVHLIKEKVFAKIREEGEGVDISRWVVDTRAINHMTTTYSIFSELNIGVCGTAKFDDDSIIFSCKNGEHRSLSSIYFIPKLKTNILSVGQLDEIG